MKDTDNYKKFRSYIPPKAHDIGTRLRMIRKEINKTQEEVAEAIDIERQTYTRYEDNLGKMSIQQLKYFIDYANEVKPDLYLNSEFFFDKKADLSKITKPLLNTLGISAEVIRIFEDIKHLAVTQIPSLNENRITPLNTLNTFLSHEGFVEFINYMTYLKNQTTDYYNESYEQKEIFRWRQEKHIMKFIIGFLDKFQPLSDYNWGFLDRRSDDMGNPN